jgi:hypothetical protein
MEEPRPTDPVPHPPTRQDVSVLIGLMALLEGSYLVRDVEDYLMGRMGDRFRRVGLLEDGFTLEDVRWALNAMNYRLRHALGEDD